MPQVEVRSRRIGGATFQIPMEIRPERKISMAMTWMIKFSRKRNEKSMAQKLAGEIMAAYKEEERLSRKKLKFIRWLRLTKLFPILDFK